MTIVYRKLAMLEKNLAEREEHARICGYSDSGVDKDFQRRLTALMDQVRYI